MESFSTHERVVKIALHGVRAFYETNFDETAKSPDSVTPVKTGVQNLLKDWILTFVRMTKKLIFDYLRVHHF